jgi:hypothetical protein
MAVVSSGGVRARRSIVRMRMVAHIEVEIEWFDVDAIEDTVQRVAAKRGFR